MTTRTREYRRTGDRWSYRETETYTNGNTYTNYFRQAYPSQESEEGQTENYYQASSEAEYNR
jgi:hypothetical protein